MADGEKKPRGPKPVHASRIMLRISQDVIDRIDLSVGEKLRSAFIREAIDRELKRRERSTKR